METLIAFLVLIGILIWFHELGHFLIAKLFGVKVEVFSIGFGPQIFAKQLGETTYQIAAIPLGGYVKLYGEEEKVDDPRAFSSKPNWQKILIALGGPVFNIILTVFLLTVVFWAGVDVPKYMKEPAVVGYVEENSWAEKVGIKPGDRIVQIGSVKIEKWEDIKKAVIENALEKREKLIIVVERAGRTLTLTAEAPKLETGKESLGINPYIPPVVGRVFKEVPGVGPSPAYQVGLKEGDRIVKVNGVPVNSWYDAVKLIRNSKGNLIKLTIEREGRLIEKEVVPAIHPQTKFPVLGIAPKIETVKEAHPLGESLKLAINRTEELVALTFKVLGGLFTGAISVKTLGGPIAIAQFAGQAAESGIIPYLSSMAFISLQLGIFNLLPLPVLDGGLILLFLIEMLRRKPLPEKFKEYWQKVGFALIISLMVFVVINDILRLIMR
ncbi:RIP metalloprotease RseP [Hydrogenivirga sp.]